MPIAGWGFRGLNVAAIVATFAVITLGGIVRVTESGLGCPDWPLCHGRIIPPFEFHVLVEYSHRLMATVVSGLVLAMTFVAWRRYRYYPMVIIPVSVTVLLLGVQVGLGAITVLNELPSTIVTVHLAVSQAIFAMLIATLVITSRTVFSGNRRVFWWTLAATIGTYGVVLSGSYMVGRGAAFACLGWPLCDNMLIPSDTLGLVHMFHRLMAGFIGLVVLMAGLVSWKEGRGFVRIRRLGLVIIGLGLTQVLMGAANPWTDFAPWTRVLHLSLATGLWGSLVMLLLLTCKIPTQWLSGSETRLSTSRVKSYNSWLAILGDYISLTKPRIMVLLLVTAFGGMILAAEGVPPLGVLLSVLFGGALASGGASALNHWLDQDIDQKMRRTQGRPVASLRVTTTQAVTFGSLLTVLAFIVLAMGANLLSGFLAMGGTLLYIVVYTQWLKRSTVHNIVIGGAAGAMPPLVGWAAVTGGLDLPALYLFAIIFFWTPPHFWALALLIRDDYAAAGVPMLPVVYGEAKARMAIFLYTLLLLPLTMLFFLVTPSLGLLYLVGVFLLGVGFIVYAFRLVRGKERVFAVQAYKYSLLYLFLLFGLVITEAFV